MKLLMKKKIQHIKNTGKSVTQREIIHLGQYQVNHFTHVESKLSFEISIQSLSKLWQYFVYASSGGMVGQDGPELT